MPTTCLRSAERLCRSTIAPSSSSRLSPGDGERSSERRRPARVGELRAAGERRAELHGWISAAARRCVVALEDGRPAPAAVLERSTVHEEPTFVLATGHDPARLQSSPLYRGRWCRDRAAEPCASTRSCRRSGRTRSACRSWTASWRTARCGYAAGARAAAGDARAACARRGAGGAVGGDGRAAWRSTVSAVS